MGREELKKKVDGRLTAEQRENLQEVGKVIENNIRKLFSINYFPKYYSECCYFSGIYYLCNSFK